VILVDTSIWIAHLCGRRAATALGSLLEDDEVLIHPWIIGELALGNIGASRRRILADLRRLPTCSTLGDDDVFELIDSRRLSGSGIGWVDAHLLASTLVVKAQLWTADRHLAAAAGKCGVAYLAKP
jgi:predicted nucleic acid-binding protein